MRRLGQSQRSKRSRVCCSSRESPGLASRCKFNSRSCWCRCGLTRLVMSSAGVRHTHMHTLHGSYKDISDRCKHANAKARQHRYFSRRHNKCLVSYRGTLPIWHIKFSFFVMGIMTRTVKTVYNVYFGFLERVRSYYNGQIQKCVLCFSVISSWFWWSCSSEFNLCSIFTERPKQILMYCV